MTMTLAEFRQAFPSESSYIERKRGIGRGMQDTVVAFSNSDGGVILVGVSDDGSIAGRELTPGTEDDLHERFSSVRDPGRYALHRLLVDGVSVVAISVARREEGFSQTSEGRVLVRRGTRDVTLFGSELRTFLNERSLSRFEESDLGIPLARASAELLGEVADAYGWSRESELYERLPEAGLATRGDGGGNLTVAGGLFLRERPDEKLGKSYVEVLRFPDDGPDYDRRVEIRGAAHEQVERTTSLVADELGTEMVVLGIRRHELPRIPRVVLREAIANAVAHRSYELTGSSIRVELRPDAVVVSSPGGLPEPVTEENIRETQAARNVTVVTTLRRFGLAEDAGRGVDVMEDVMREELLDPPSFRDTGHSVIVRLPVHSPVAPAERAWVREIEERGVIQPFDRILLVHAARGEALTNSRVRELLGLDSREARDALRRLRDAGLLIQVGHRGGAEYVLHGSLHPPAGLRLSREELKAVILELAKSDPVTNARVRERTGLDRVEALRLLDELTDEGRLRRVGRRRGTRYVLG
jgi:ATP-dependent DNA helicase RecG